MHVIIYFENVIARKLGVQTLVQLLLSQLVPMVRSDTVNLNKLMCGRNINLFKFFSYTKSEESQSKKNLNYGYLMISDINMRNTLPSP